MENTTEDKPAVDTSSNGTIKSLRFHVADLQDALEKRAGMPKDQAALAAHFSILYLSEVMTPEHFFTERLKPDAEKS